MFKKDKPYTRRKIQEMVGGEVQTYLPQRDKKILAGCFSAEMNPKAPEEIFAGNLPKVEAKAELLGAQLKTVFPVFIRQRNSDRIYYFQGYYKCVGLTNRRKTLLGAEALSGRHGKLSYVLYLKRVK